MEVSVRNEKDLIHNAYELLGSGECWIKGHAKVGDRYCIAGALGEAARRAGKGTDPIIRDSMRIIATSIGKLFSLPGSIHSIPSFNDSSSTTWQDVDAVFQDAMK